jgi:nucleotide-binding universal stress UspA family protein
VIREREKGIARDILTESKKRYGAVLFARRGFNPLNDHVLGSVANKLIEKLTHTTLCLVGIGRKPRNEKLLVALDTSERAMKALEVVYRYMNPSAVTVTLFHAVRDVGLFQKGYADLFNLRAVSGKREGDEADILSLFRVYKDRLIEGGLDSTSVDTKVVTGVKSRAGAIIQEARDGDYDTVVMGRKGQSNVAEFPMGRVTRKVIQMATDKAVWVAS